MTDSPDVEYANYPTVPDDRPLPAGLRYVYVGDRCIGLGFDRADLTPEEEAKILAAVE